MEIAYELIGVHHIAGHIYANELVEDIEYPCLCLVVSGGHSELVYMKKPFSFEVIGQTLDDAIGEAYDKVGRVLHLPYPGGPVIDKMALTGNHSYNLPLPLNDDSYNFSFSGLKSAVINLNHNNMNTPNDSNINNKVIRHKIIGNVGEVEGTQFIEFCKKHNKVVTAEDFIYGRASAPESPEEISILVSSVVNKVSFLSGINDTEEPTVEQKLILERVIRSLFRFPQSEYTIVGLKSLINFNRKIVKQVYMEMDDKNILNFIKRNKYALGLDDEGFSGQNKWLAMWE